LGFHKATKRISKPYICKATEYNKRPMQINFPQSKRNRPKASRKSIKIAV
jgi:hypothetical protein